MVTGMTKAKAFDAKGLQGIYELFQIFRRVVFIDQHPVGNLAGFIDFDQREIFGSITCLDDEIQSFSGLSGRNQFLFQRIIDQRL